MQKEKYCVYVLIKDKNPIYVGCSGNLKTRLSNHKKLKDFDSHIVIKRYDNKKSALIAENSIIRFISIFGDGIWLNSLNIHLVIEGDHKGYNSFNELSNTF